MATDKGARARRLYRDAVDQEEREHRDADLDAHIAAQEREQEEAWERTEAVKARNDAKRDAARLRRDNRTDE